MTTLQIIPVFIPIGGGGDLTPEDIKVFIAIWIILNTLWASSLLITSVRYFLQFKDTHKDYRKNYIDIRIDRGWDLLLVALMDWTMLFMWVVVLFLKFAIFLSTFL